MVGDGYSDDYCNAFKHLTGGVSAGEKAALLTGNGQADHISLQPHPANKS